MNTIEPAPVPSAHHAIACIGCLLALLVLMRTRWGQARPIRKCLILSLIAIIAIAALIFLGTQISTILSQIGAQI
mgnify:CR=1 FL=1